MGKRFTDTEKYRKQFMRGLLGPYKVLWDFLYHDCNHAGIWICDFEIAEILIGFKGEIDWVKAIEYFNEDEMRVIVFDRGKKWFIVPFIEFQYGELNPDNRVHKSVLDILKKEGVYDNIDKGLVRGIDGLKDKEKDKDKEEVIKKKDWVLKCIRLRDRDSQWFEKLAVNNEMSVGGVKELLEVFIEAMEMDDDMYRPIGDYFTHFRNWLPKNKDKVKKKKRVFKNEELEKRIKERSKV